LATCIWDSEDAKDYRPYGVSFIDVQLGGGGTAGEVYGFLAPSGVCKTLLSVQMAVSCARHGSKASLGVVYYVTYPDALWPQWEQLFEYVLSKEPEKVPAVLRNVRVGRVGTELDLSEQPLVLEGTFTKVDVVVKAADEIVASEEKGGEE
jgi:hypothetical protein